MPRLVPTALGVLALLLSAPTRAGAAEVVRPALTSWRTAPPPENQTGAAPRQDAPTDAAFGAQVTTVALPASTDAPASFALAESPAVAPREVAPAILPRVLPDARAPPA